MKLPCPTLRSSMAWLAVLLLAVSGEAFGFTSDARQLGMAGSQVIGSRQLSGRNVAFQQMPARPDQGGYVVPLPLGLIALAADFPTLDSSDPDFSVTRLANLALNPPFFLELNQPSELNGDIDVFIAQNEFSIDFEDAQQFLPQRPLDVGSVYAVPVVGLGVQGARAYLSPMALIQGSVEFDDNLYGVLAEGQPLLPNSTYNTFSDGEAMLGTAFNFGYSAPVSVDQNGDGLYLGAYMKYIMGFVMGSADTEFNMTTGDTIFGGSNPLQVDFSNFSRYSNGIGSGVGFDIGAAYRMGAFDFGVGLRDLATRVRWGRTTLEHTYLDDATDEFVTETLETDASFTQKIPVQTTFNVSWTGPATVLAADITASSFSTNFHVGAERKLGPVALRCGFLTDDEVRLQYAWGIGAGVSKLQFDLGFQTHNRSVTGERGLTLGTSIAIR